MSDRPDLAQMGEPELRDWLERLPAQELVEILVSYIRAFLHDGVDDFGASRGALGGLLEMSFPQIVNYLKENTRLPELSRLRVEGDEVRFQTAAGSDIIINATGLQDAPGLPGVGGRSSFARSTPDPTRPGRPAAPPADAEASGPGTMATEVAPRPAPSRRGGGLFDGGGSGVGESGTEPRPRPAAGAAAAPSGPPSVRPNEPPRAKPGEPVRPGVAARPGDPKGAAPEKDDKKGGKKDDRFSMLEFD